MTVRVKLKLRGINQLMKSAPVTAQVAREAHRLATAAGANFEFFIKPHRYTSRAFIVPANDEGRKEQADNAVLERVVGS